MEGWKVTTKPSLIRSHPWRYHRLVFRMKPWQTLTLAPQYIKKIYLHKSLSPMTIHRGPTGSHSTQILFCHHIKQTRCEKTTFETKQMTSSQDKTYKRSGSSVNGHCFSQTFNFTLSKIQIFYEPLKGSKNGDRKSTRLNSSHSSVSRMPSSA